VGGGIFSEHCAGKIFLYIKGWLGYNCCMDYRLEYTYES